MRMTCGTIVAAIVLSFAAFGGSPQPTDLYLLIGQSNMAGRGITNAANRLSSERVLKFTKDRKWAEGVEPIHYDRPFTGAGPGLAFARSMADADGHAVIGLIPSAEGGTPLSRWEPGCDLYTNAIARTKAALSAGGKLRGILWHQGEADSWAKETAETYAVRLTNMVTQLRRDLGAENVPFLAGEVGLHYEISLKNRGREPFVREVNAQMKKAVTSLSSAALVSAAGLAPGPDGIHFTTESAYELGRRYAREMQRMRKSAQCDLAAKPVFGELLYGTQYYRAPTPLAEEWDGDLAKMGDYHLETIQLRLNWRQNERAEGVYDFSDVDRLMDLAEKHGKKVVIKFLLECAPQYVFDKYNGTRIGPTGELLRPQSIGAFYVGGWLPCFTNPKVAERAAKFVEEVVKRYKGRRHLVMWNAWNEPRCKPIGECFCDSCRRAYGEHMKRRFGTIEALNRFYGVAEESFENIALPGSSAGYWDIYEFKMFKSGECLYNNLKFVYDAVRRHDATRPVISHVGCTGGFQTRLRDICDDWKVMRAVDGWGTSLPLSTCMGSLEERMEFCRLNDFMRSLNPDYFLYEIYPGISAFKYQYDTPWDMYYKLYAALACGSKGMFFWQYRAERVGDENDSAGLARADGSPRPVLDAVREFGETVGEIGKAIVGFYPRRADVAIVFDYRSHMMSLVEDSQGFVDVVPEKNMTFYYAHAHRGFYHMMKQAGVDVDYLNANDMARLSEYKVAYFPYYTMMDPAAVPHMEKFVAQGGILIADEGFGLRDLNTWMNPYDIKCGNLMKARLLERRKGGRVVAVNGKSIDAAGYHSEYRVEGGGVVYRFADGVPAVQVVPHGRGKTCLLGFSLGYSSMKKRSGIWGDVFDRLTKEANLARTSGDGIKGGLEERRLYKGDEQFIFLINTTATEKHAFVDGRIIKTYAKGRLDGSIAVVPAKSCFILRAECSRLDNGRGR